MLNDVGIRTVINGPIPVSADGEPVMGIAEGIENFFIACGFTAGIAASGGAGLAMANWIANGDPGMDLWPFDLRRFGKLHNGLAYLRDAAIESYARYYVIAWPEEEREACRPLRRSPLHAMLAANGAVHGQKFGFERPNYFLRNGEKGPSIETFERSALAPVVGREHKAIREGVALIDMSSFSKFEITGQGRCAICNGSRPAISTRARARSSTPSCSTPRAASRPTSPSCSRPKARSMW